MDTIRQTGIISGGGEMAPLQPKKSLEKEIPPDFVTIGGGEKILEDNDIGKSLAAQSQANEGPKLNPDSLPETSKLPFLSRVTAGLMLGLALLGVVGCSGGGVDVPAEENPLERVVENSGEKQVVSENSVFRHKNIDPVESVRIDIIR